MTDTNQVFVPQSDSSARTWATVAHLSAFVALFFGFSWLGPLLIYLFKKDQHPFVAEHSREALNFNLTVFAVEIAGIALTWMLGVIAPPLIVLLVLGWLAITALWIFLTIRAALRSNRGDRYRYPWTIRLVS